MKLLLDTHAFLWFCGGNPLLSSAARQAIEDSKNQRFVSHVSAWEIAIKISLGKLKIQTNYATLFSEVMTANGFLPIVPDYIDYMELLVLPFHHRDPFDRLLVAQAKVGSMQIISCDPSLAAYEIPMLW